MSTSPENHKHEDLSISRKVIFESTSDKIDKNICARLEAFTVFVNCR